MHFPKKWRGLHEICDRNGNVRRRQEHGAEELMARDALNREESCGGHFRSEHQTEDGEALRHDDKFAYAAVWEYKGMDNVPEMTIEQLDYEFVHRAQRNYKD